MLAIRNFGKKSLQEIKNKLAELGISLGMAVKPELREAMQLHLTVEEQED